MFTQKEIHQALQNGAVKNFDAEKIFSSISTDTRTIQKNALFIALKGENFNGEDFAQKAIDAGASGIVVSKNFQKELPCTIFFVDDTLQAYLDIAKAWRQKFSIPVVAITGSNGKTTTKDFVAQVLGDHVCKTQKNFNNEVGLPKTLLNIQNDTKFAVVEIGMRGLGQIERLAKIAQPTIGVVTNVSETHIELLGSIENIARAKSELARYPKLQTLILNADDRFVLPMKELSSAKILTFGLKNKNADVFCESYEMGDAQIKFKVNFFKKNCVEFVLPPSVLGEHNLYNALAALCVGYSLNFSFETMKENLQNTQLTGQRLEILKRKNYTVINDAYNASPASMREAIKVLAQMNGKRKIAVLGDMLELGKFSEELHKNLGKILQEYGIQNLITIGKLAKKIPEGFTKNLNDAQIFSFDENQHEQAGKFLQKFLKNDDVILLKGSHGMHVEKLLDYI